MAILVNALFLTKESAQMAIESLLSEGIPREQISVAMSDATRNRHFGPDDVLENAHDADRGARVGGAVGLALAGLASIGAFAVAGPLAALLVGVSGGMGGTLAGALVGSGVPEHHAHHVSKRLEDGGILIGVYVPEAQEGHVQRLLRAAGGEFVQTA